MCGIAGVINTNKNLVAIDILKSMTDIVAHRGPDGDGHWISENGNVGLGHRRLSIIDLSHEADQPMHYLDRYSIVFNGEIYNYIELKEALLKQGFLFKTQSDTEVLMALYHRDKENCLQHLDGMFSFVIYDKQNNTAFCARDRFGEKPFFYSYEKGKHFYFGSEMKCLWAAGINKKINDVMLFNYLSFGYLENPDNLQETFFENCSRLEHSNYLVIDCNSMNIEIKKYYQLNWKDVNSDITVSEASTKFKELMHTSISRRLRSDVSVGSSLSGGLDSSLVVCMLDKMKLVSQQQDTFSAVFPGYKKDERKYIDIVTKNKKVNTHFVTPNENGLIEDLEKLCWHQEEPFGSASIYAQYCVMKLAKEKNVTVLLDGQGADEILAGYHPYFQPFFSEIKKSNLKEFNKQYAAYNSMHINNPINGIAKKNMGDFIRQISPNFVKPAKQLRTYWQQKTKPVLNKDFYEAYKSSGFNYNHVNFDNLNQSLHNSTLHSGLQQLLRYADRNSMAHSREVRLPFLCHELVEFLFTLPSTFKLNDGWTKWIMRESMQILPEEIRWRIDKIGYEPPQKNWMNKQEVKQLIVDSRNKLVDNRFLHANMKNIEPTSENATESKDKSWIHLMAGKII